MPNVVNADAEGGAPLATEAGTSALDLAFLDTQTFGDRALQREVLVLFVEQARRVVPTLPGLPSQEQRDAAHLLKGSARGVGAWAAAAIAEAYELAEPVARAAMHGDLAATFWAAEAAIADIVDTSGVAVVAHRSR